MSIDIPPKEAERLRYEQREYLRLRQELFHVPMPSTQTDPVTKELTFLCRRCLHYRPDSDFQVGKHCCIYCLNEKYPLNLKVAFTVAEAVCNDIGIPVEEITNSKPHGVYARNMAAALLLTLTNSSYSDVVDQIGMSPIQPAVERILAHKANYGRQQTYFSLLRTLRITLAQLAISN